MTAEWTNSLQGLGLLAAALFTGWQAWQGRRRAAEAKVNAEEARANTQKVRDTLTTNNGGSHVKDSLDRIERRQEDDGALLRDHLTVSARTEAHIFERLERLERRRSRFPFL